MNNEKEIIQNNLTVQDLISDFFDNGSNDDNETVQVLDFVREYSVPINNDQAKALFLLESLGMNKLANYVLNVRKHLTPFEYYTKMVEMMTLAHRIKGSAKLDNVLKQNANPGLDLNTEKAARSK